MIRDVSTYRTADKQDTIYSDFHKAGISQKTIDDFFEELDDFRQFCAAKLMIKDFYGKIIPLVFNELQEYVWKIVKDLMDRGIPIRLIILKCRQTGMSTLFEAFLFWVSLRDFNQKMLIIGHEKDASANLFEMFNRYYEELEPTMRPQIETNQAERKLKYAVLKNDLIVKTAGAGIDFQKAGTGRSGTFQYIHATECAFYTDYETTFKGLLQASLEAKMIVLETTANGFNLFRNDWISAKSGFTDDIPIFLAWIKFKTYSKEFTDDDQKAELLRTLGAAERYNEYKGEENILMDKFSCSLEQLNWRRWAINNPCKGSVRTFHQEYPTTDEEAFLSSGRPAFDMGVCTSNFKDCEDTIPLRVGYLAYTLDGGVEFRENPKGYIKIFKEIEVEEDEYNVFAAGTDVAEGLDQGDRSICKVMDRRTHDIIMTWQGHIDIAIFAEELYKIQIFLKHKVYFCIDRTGSGRTVIVNGWALQLNQYYQRNFAKGYEVASSEELGFLFKVNNRDHLLDNLTEWIRENAFIDEEKEAWSEAMTFVYNKKGKRQAQGKDKDPGTKCFDDRVLTWALLFECHDWMPAYFKETPVVPVARPFMEEMEEACTETTF